MQDSNQNPKSQKCHYAKFQLQKQLNQSLFCILAQSKKGLKEKCKSNRSKNKA